MGARTCRWRRIAGCGKRYAAFYLAHSRLSTSFPATSEAGRPRRKGVLMSQQPRHNEERSYRYPMRRIVAIIDGDANLKTALDALQQAGLDVTKVNVLSGPEGAR